MLAWTGCDSPNELPSDPPKTVENVASGGFSAPMDAVASPDGRTLYFIHVFDLLGVGVHHRPTVVNVMSTVLEVPITEIAAGGPVPRVTALG